MAGKRRRPVSVVGAYYLFNRCYGVQRVECVCPGKASWTVWQYMARTHIEPGDPVAWGGQADRGCMDAVSIAILMDLSLPGGTIHDIKGWWGEEMLRPLCGCDSIMRASARLVAVRLWNDLAAGHSGPPTPA